MTRKPDRKVKIEDDVRKVDGTKRVGKTISEEDEPGRWIFSTLYVDLPDHRDNREDDG